MFCLLLAILLGKKAQVISGPKLVDYKKVIHEDPSIKTKVDSLREEVEKFSDKFPVPGYKDI